jgi:beta-lactamase class D
MKTLYTLSLVCSVSFLFSCSVNKARTDNELKQYFEKAGAEGCFTMLNNADGEITVYNMAFDTLRVQPAGTFGIVNALIALQTGVLPDENTAISPDSTVLNMDSLCNTNMNIKEALASDCVLFDQALSRKIGKANYQKWLDSISYGNKKTIGAVDSFWCNNQLAISPDEQLGLMKKMYFAQLPFRKSVQESVAEMLLREDNSAYKLYYKNGSGLNAKKTPVQWTIGWVVENRHVYFFSTLIECKGDMSDSSTSLSITKNILKHYGFFEGKK